MLPLALACAAPDGPPQLPASPGPDERFLDESPCADASDGLTIEETTGFTPGGRPTPLVVLMGGSTEVDAAAARFAEAAGRGDLLVLRATGSTSSYTGWFADELAMDERPGAVSTVRIDDAARGGDDAVLCRVARADAVWLAGGDQSDYLIRWPDELHAALARAIARGAAVGGTSAGAMSLSELTFDAAQGSVDATGAMAAPLDDAVSLSRSPFAPVALAGTLVDTHFDARSRLGRLITFLARAAQTDGPVIGIGIDEETAVVIDGQDVEVSGAGAAWLVALDGAPAL
ncbi:MAG: hypothetical protein A2138_18445, partial [Deltaproteobacteria bacterium RBG_16_71_12]